MADTGTSTHHTSRDLRTAIERAGYYPALVAEAVDAAVGAEPVRSFLVHQETTLDHSEVRRHVTVLVLTPSRLVVGHTDDHAPDETSSHPYATSSTEVVPLDAVTSVVVTRVVPDPAAYRPGGTPRELVLTVGWGAVGRLDLEPATCADPSCEADHGYTGTLNADDLSLRVSEAGDGADVVAQAVAFGQTLSEATAVHLRPAR
ncbi:MAG: DUF5998 family protein [Actinomycetes bacterium]